MLLNIAAFTIVTLSGLFFFVPSLAASVLFGNGLSSALFGNRKLLHLSLFILQWVFLLDATQWFEHSGHLKRKLVIIMLGSSIIVFLFPRYGNSSSYIILFFINIIFVSILMFLRSSVLLFGKEKGRDTRSAFVFSSRDFFYRLKRNSNNKKGIVFNPAGYFDGKQIDWENGGETISMKWDIQQLIQTIKQNNVSEIILAHPSLTYKDVTDFMMNSNTGDMSVKISKNLYNRLIGGESWEENDPLCLIDLKKTEDISECYAYIKRFVDLLFSFTILLAIMPVFIITAIAIKLSSRGPVFYKQVRAGKHGKPFIMYKFRSMDANADALLEKYVKLNELDEPVYKLKHDPRIFPLGRFLRKTSIDELPQIFNVIKNDMSWVGIRPEDIKVVRYYNNFFRQRLMVKPGITGLQQIKCRGIQSLKKRVKYDMIYRKRQSFWLDLKIIIRSFTVVLSRKGAW
ncbi:MAG: exopolysaccharide biosynthesis polyprenyl glycosylphosphotransferase [Nitrospiraceae bacterium]|nr:MAG: exopolysaccharide biosynthesis polyprenyl glycosylphosphotransferase [Nitrospiraceae bacterium]